MLAMLNCEKKKDDLYKSKTSKIPWRLLSITISYFGFVAARYRAYALIF